MARRVQDTFGVGYVIIVESYEGLIDRKCSIELLRGKKDEDSRGNTPKMLCFPIIHTSEARGKFKCIMRGYVVARANHRKSASAAKD